MISTHEFSVSYPRGTWPVYTCTVCGMVKCPSMIELNSNIAPSWWNSECVKPAPLTNDDVQWLMGTGRYSQ